MELRRAEPSPSFSSQNGPVTLTMRGSGGPGRVVRSAPSASTYRIFCGGEKKVACPPCRVLTVELYLFQDNWKGDIDMYGNKYKGIRRVRYTR